MHRRFYPLLLAVLAGCLFYPSLFAPFCIIDDVEVFEHQKGWSDWSLREIFLPQTDGMLYYRPVLALSQVFDRFFWDLDPFWMHAENVSLHILNVLLVYFIALKLSELIYTASPLLALSAAALFASHPLVTESVNWISGRTDLLAGFFVLLSCYFLLCYRQKHSRLIIVLALVAAIFAVLSKESAIAFFPGGLLILAARKPQFADPSAKPRNWVKSLLIPLFFLSGIGVFAVLRGGATESNYSRIGMTLKFIFNDIGYAFTVCLRAFGFYVKKLFFPWPNNFAIVEVDPLYDLLGIFLLPVLFYLLWRRSLPSAIFLAGLCTILPAFVMVFNQIAWTPYAERYLYMACALTAPVICLAYRQFWRHCEQTYFIPQFLIVVIAGAFLMSTVQRNLIWQDNYLLVKDSAEKSPYFKDVQLLYGRLLIERGEYVFALKQLRKTAAMASLGYDENPDLAIVDLFENMNDYAAATKHCLVIYDKSRGRSFAAVDRLIGLLEKEKQNTDILAVQESLLTFDPQRKLPLTAYLHARLSFVLGDFAEALQQQKTASDELASLQLSGSARKNLQKRLLALASSLGAE